MTESVVVLPPASGPLPAELTSGMTPVTGPGPGADVGTGAPSAWTTALACVELAPDAAVAVTRTVYEAPGVTPVMTHDGVVEVELGTGQLLVVPPATGVDVTAKLNGPVQVGLAKVTMRLLKSEPRVPVTFVGAPGGRFGITVTGVVGVELPLAAMPLATTETV